ncbi:RNA 3'-terminal phosphate cyclase domain-containing protein [Amylocarpus encephaloides]|uniref:RNA 3'-terminal phosphate cyclase domain-containing protein n=1 Tax=Amylocarpus encephaloides TaxID=45428 RepID=A0A9P8C1P5_9HELO|nr:RNA 3'-terminal phosphate cyclase domain-containing protein [Amylocarpus encephaloides]
MGRPQSQSKLEPHPIVKIDGRQGEGGGQLVRLKAQHVSCINYLADATAAEVTDVVVGSKSVGFRPTIPPADILNRNIKIKSDSAGSVLLVFQALLPFLVFASSKEATPVSLEIQGGTNVNFSPLLPSLERFGIQVERELGSRGWSHGTRAIGSAKFKIHPLPFGKSLTTPNWPLDRGEITRIDASIIVPLAMHDSLQSTLHFELGLVFAEAEANILLLEDSKHHTRMYLLLVAHTSTGLRFGRDWLYDKSAKKKSWDQLSTEMAQGVVDALDRDVQKGGLVDEHLQDQLIVFQSLADGKSQIPGFLNTATSNGERTHTTTARWVTSQLLPGLKWIDNGRMCEGLGWTSGYPEVETTQEAADAVAAVHAT